MHPQGHNTTFKVPSSHSVDRVAVSFDHDHTVANARLLLSGNLITRLSLEQLIDKTVTLLEPLNSR